MTAIEALEEAWRRFDREYSAGEIKIGDRVRWWPEATWLGTPAANARYSDGIMVDRDVIRIESHGPNGWSSRDGLVGDWRSCAGHCVRKLAEVSVDTPAGPIKVTADPTVPPREVRFVQPGAGDADLGAALERARQHPPAAGWSLSPPTQPAGYRPAKIDWEKLQNETPRVVTTCPGYNAVFHIEPDPPDLAERQATRVAEHQRREAERGPFDYDVPDYSGILKAPYEQPARPDGFDQRAVDAARAALLAPAPPRYPRRSR